MSTRRTGKAAAKAARTMETAEAASPLTAEEIAAIKAPGIAVIEVEEDRPFFHAVRVGKPRPIDQLGHDMDRLSRSVEGV